MRGVVGTGSRPAGPWKVATIGGGGLKPKKGPAGNDQKCGGVIEKERGESRRGAAMYEDPGLSQHMKGTGGK